MYIYSHTHECVCVCMYACRYTNTHLRARIHAYLAFICNSTFRDTLSPPARRGRLAKLSG